MADLVFSRRYAVIEKLAQGGMGVVYRAMDRTLDRMVAIKLVHAHLNSDVAFVERFLREARTMAKLQHTNIVTLFSVEEDQGTHYLVMEYFQSTNLRQVLQQRQRLPPHEAVRIALQIARALAYAHSRGVVHRDIKPANVLLDKACQAKLTDFGIAAARDEARLTSAGDILGTPEYMSPEQARGGRLDGRSDLYSLGMVLFELLSGQHPFQGMSKTAMIGRLASDQSELPLEFPSEVPPLLQGVVRDLVRQLPDDRIQEAEALVSQLHELRFVIPFPGDEQGLDSEATVLHQRRTPSSEPVAQATLLTPRTVVSEPLRPLQPEPTQVRTDFPMRPELSDEALRQPITFEDPPRPVVPSHEASRPAASWSPPSRQAVPPRRKAPLFIVLAMLGGLALAGGIGYLTPAIVPPLPSVPAPDRTKQSGVVPAPPSTDKSPGDQPMSDSGRHGDDEVKAVLERFRKAYETRDLGALETLTDLGESRLRNLRTTYSNYATIESSIRDLTIKENEAIATLFLDRLVTPDGKTPDISPLGRKIVIRVPRTANNDWGKIVW